MDSHGCNVVLKAIDMYVEHLRLEGQQVASQAVKLIGEKAPDLAFGEAIGNVTGDLNRNADALKRWFKEAVARANAQEPRRRAHTDDLDIEWLGRRLKKVAGAIAPQAMRRWRHNQLHRRIGG